MTKIMRKLAFLILFFCFGGLSLAFPTKATFILFQPSALHTYCQLLFLKDNGDYKYYELELFNERFLEIKLTDSLSGVWNLENESIHLYSDFYCNLETEEQKQLCKVLMNNHFIDDYMCLRIIDDCTLSIPNLYHQFRCVDSLIPSSNDSLIMNSFIKDLIGLLKEKT